jgi:peptidoglycan L-alanyl-D-glutamate endopeptidase CwlK
MSALHQFGKGSAGKLLTGHSEIKLLAPRALYLSPYDFTIVHVWRGEDVQNALFDSGASRKRWPDSKHNARNALTLKSESNALDFAPWIDGAIPWNDTHIFAIIAGAFFAAAIDLNIKIRYGGDWDSDGSTKDQTLMDWGHIERVGT